MFVTNHHKPYFYMYFLDIYIIILINNWIILFQFWLFTHIICLCSVLFSHHDTMHLQRVCNSWWESLSPPRRWCKAGRGPVSSPDQSRCLPHTPHRPCRGSARSVTAHPHREDTRCMARTELSGRSWSSRSCIRTLRHSSRCRGSAYAWDLCTLYTSDISLCDWTFQRMSRLEREKERNNQNDEIITV